MHQPAIEIPRALHQGMSDPVIYAEDGGAMPLPCGITTVGRSPQMGLRLADATVSPLHAELVRRGPYVYVEDLGLSLNGTHVNGRPVERRLLIDGDVIAFGSACCEFSGRNADEPLTEVDRDVVLTARQREALLIMCSPQDNSAFREPRPVDEVAHLLGVTESAAENLLDRIAQRLGVRGRDRYIRIANRAVALRIVPDTRRQAARLRGIRQAVGEDR